MSLQPITDAQCPSLSACCTAAKPARKHYAMPRCSAHHDIQWSSSSATLAYIQFFLNAYHTFFIARHKHFTMPTSFCVDVTNARLSTLLRQLVEQFNRPLVPHSTVSMHRLNALDPIQKRTARLCARPAPSLSQNCIQPLITISV